MNEQRMNKWNDADTTLTVAALSFLFAVILKIFHPESIFAEGFLFVTEAAMVGGVADWFAVTALFKKPLGFPFHTAILPNRREEFVKASVQMVQGEFFSRRTIFKKISQIKLLPLLVEYLEKPEIRQFLLTELLEAAKEYVATMNKEASAKIIANKLRREFCNLPIEVLISECGSRIKQSEVDKGIFVGLVKKIRVTAEKTETRKKLQAVLEKYAQEKTQSAGVFSMLMAGLAQALDLVNFEEAAEIMQTQLLKLLDELSIDSPLQRRTLNECRLKISEMADTPQFRDLAERIQIDLAAALPIEDAIESAFNNLEKQIVSVDLVAFISVTQNERSLQLNTKNLGVALFKIFDEAYDNFVALLKVDGPIKTEVEKFVYDLTIRVALYAQPMIGRIAKFALEKLTADQLNEIVYGKAEKDFVWIRMNGSIVGSIIGLAIFVVIKLIG